MDQFKIQPKRSDFKYNFEEGEPKKHWYKMNYNDEDDDYKFTTKSKKSNSNNSNNNNNNNKTASSKISTNSNGEYFEFEIEDLFNNQLEVSDFDMVYCENRNKILYRVFNPAEKITLQQIFDAPEEEGYAHNLTQSQNNQNSNTQKNYTNNKQ